jgi:hypothetical protein
VLLLAFVVSAFVRFPVFLVVLAVWFMAARYTYARRGPSARLRA